MTAEQGSKLATSADVLLFLIMYSAALLLTGLFVCILPNLPEHLIYDRSNLQSVKYGESAYCMSQKINKKNQTPKADEREKIMKQSWNP